MSRQDRRTQLVVERVAQITVRPGVTLRYRQGQMLVTDDDGINPDTGTGPVTYVDDIAGAAILAAVRDSAVSDTELLDAATYACAAACVRADLYTLCEWFCVDGVPVFEPVDASLSSTGVTVDIHHHASPFTRPASALDLSEWEEVEQRITSRVATDLSRRCELGPLGRFEVYGPVLIHVGTYHDRDTAEVKEYTWTRDCLGDIAVCADGNTGAAVRAAVCVEMFTSAAESITHEVAEWFCVNGERLFDPHPFATAHYDDLRAALTFTVSPLLAVRG